MDFTAVAHDLRAPLNVMLGHMQLLAVERLSDTDRRRLGVVEAQIHRMVRLLDRCTDPAFSLAPVDPGALIADVASELSGVLERRGIEIMLNIGQALPCVTGDSDLLHRILVNILSNKADAIAGTGRIRIDASLEHAPTAGSGTLHIDVVDSGRGVHADLIGRVFERGFTTKSTRNGHGIGLGICGEIVQMHGGDMQRSSKPGNGTTVRVSLPLGA